jgi:hypothetical protein
MGPGAFEQADIDAQMLMLTPFEMQATPIGHRVPGTDHRHGSQIDPAERSHGLAPQTRQQRRGHIRASEMSLDAT